MFLRASEDQTEKGIIINFPVQKKKTTRTNTQTSSQTQRSSRAHILWMGGKHFYDSSSPAFDGQRCSSTWHYSRNIASWPVRCRPDKFFLSARPPPPPPLQVLCRPEPFRLNFFTAHYNLHSASKLLHPGQIISLEISLGSLLPLVVSRFTTPSFRFSTLRAKKMALFHPGKLRWKCQPPEKLTDLFIPNSEFEPFFTRFCSSSDFVHTITSNELASLLLLLLLNGRVENRRKIEKIKPVHDYTENVSTNTA